jgi:DNA-binding transcriptional LysR family regulator
MLMYMVAARDIELRHLQALSAVADAGTFGRAAQQLGYTQSAVSQQIAALERAVGGAVFDRPGGPRPVEPTALGELLIAHAREVLARVECVVSDVDRFHAGVIGRLDIGTIQSVSTALLPTMLNRLRTERPALETRLVEHDADEQLAELLADGRLDLSFVLNPYPELERIELFDDPFVVVTTPDLVDTGPVSASMLAEQPLIGQQDNTCQRVIDAGLRRVGVEPDYVFRSNDNAAVVAMVRAGMGVAVLPLLAVDTSDVRVAVRPLDPPLPARRISIAWRRGRTLSPVAQRFIEIAQDVSANVRDRDFALVGGPRFASQAI